MKKNRLVCFENCHEGHFSGPGVRIKPVPVKLKKINGIYHTPVHAVGRTKWISTGCDTKDEATRVLAESGVERLNAVAKAGRLSSRAIGQILTGRNLTCLKALEKFRQQHESVGRADKTVANHVLVITNWMKEAKVESVPPSSVTPQHIGRWINNPALGRIRPWKCSTRQVALASVRTFFGFCAHQGWIVSDPSRLVELDYSVMSLEQKEATEKQPFTDEEVKLLLAALSRDWKLVETKKHVLFDDGQVVLFWLVAVSVAKETGLRISDIAQLQWKSFQEAGKLITWTEKTNRRMELPITKELHALISEVPVNDPDYVFPEQRAIIRDVARRSGLSVQFARLCGRLGIEDRSFHSLRHYKATHAFKVINKATLAAKLAETLSMEQIAALLGHASSKTSKGYIH